MDLVPERIYLGTVGCFIGHGLLHMLDLCEFQLNLSIHLLTYHTDGVGQLRR